MHSLFLRVPKNSENSYLVLDPPLHEFIQEFIRATSEILKKCEELLMNML